MFKHVRKYHPPTMSCLMKFWAYHLLNTQQRELHMNRSQRNLSRWQHNAFLANNIVSSEELVCHCSILSFHLVSRCVYQVGIYQHKTLKLRNAHIVTSDNSALSHEECQLIQLSNLALYYILKRDRIFDTSE